MTLTSLGIMHGTDKAAHGYLGYYETHLPADAKSILEIGVLNGSSLRMWADRFPSANIYGLDINPACQQHSAGRIRIVTGSQDDTQLLTNLAVEAGGFDVAIDDGSHINSLTLKSFAVLWPWTRLYVIEDLHCSYEDARIEWPGMEANTADFHNVRKDIDDFFVSLMHDVDTGGTSLHFYRNIAFIQREHV